MEIVENIQQQYLKSGLPDFRAGDTVKVFSKIIEGDKQRTQVFEGTVIARRGAGVNKTFMVRKLSYGVGVERIYPLHSPRIEKIEIVKQGKIRRAKLFYLRKKYGKFAKIKDKQIFEETAQESAESKQ